MLHAAWTAEAMDFADRQLLGEVSVGITEPWLVRPIQLQASLGSAYPVWICSEQCRKLIEIPQKPYPFGPWQPNLPSQGTGDSSWDTFGELHSHLDLSNIFPGRANHTCKQLVSGFSRGVKTGRWTCIYIGVYIIYYIYTVCIYIYESFSCRWQLPTHCYLSGCWCTWASPRWRFRSTKHKTKPWNAPSLKKHQVRLANPRCGRKCVSSELYRWGEACCPPTKMSHNWLQR